jgi:transcriptional regulator with XRE-family HTH domain
MDGLSEAIRAARARRALPAPRVRRLVREAAGLSQQAVADALGVTRATVTRYEGGLRSPRDPGAYLAVLERLAAEAGQEAQ